MVSSGNLTSLREASACPSRLALALGVDTRKTLPHPIQMEEKRACPRALAPSLARLRAVSRHLAASNIVPKPVDAEKLRAK